MIERTRCPLWLYMSTNIPLVSGLGSPQLTVSRAPVHVLGQSPVTFTILFADPTLGFRTMLVFGKWF